MPLLYTDGVTEAPRDSDEEWFALRRLDEAVRQARDAAANSAVSHVMRSVMAFEGERAPADDQTVVVARFGQCNDHASARAQTVRGGGTERHHSVIAPLRS